jgi:hypothetical protein
MAFRRIRSAGDLEEAEIISRQFTGLLSMNGISGRARKADLRSSNRGTEGMTRGLDFEKAQAALKRAAEKATRGTREERSGRFEPVHRRQSSPHTGVEGVRETDVGHGDKWRKR